MILDFETNKSNWQVRVALHELYRVSCVLDAIGRNVTGQSVVWLVKISPTRRAWIIRERMVTTWITADADSTDPLFALPIPDPFFTHVLEMAAGEHGVDIFCNEADGTIVGRCGDRYISVDEPTGVTFSAKDLPYRDNARRPDGATAIATVSVADLHTFANITHHMPKGIVNEVDVLPFVTMAIGNDSVAYTSDWRRQGLGRVTGAIPANTTGSITTQFYPYIVGRILKCHDPHEDAHIYVDGENADYVYFAGEEWGIRVLQDDEIIGRWHHRVVRELLNADCHVDSTSSDSLPRRIPFTLGRAQCTASFRITNDAEYVRLKYISPTRVQASLSTFDTINSLNQSMVGTRVALEGDTLVVTSDCVLNDSDHFAHHVNAFRTAIQASSSLDELLPIFSQE